MESNIAKSLGYETEEELQDDVILNSENLNKRLNETIEKERQLAVERAKAEFAEELKRQNEEMSKEETGKSPATETEQKQDNSEELVVLRKQVEEIFNTTMVEVSNLPKVLQTNLKLKNSKILS